MLKKYEYLTLEVQRGNIWNGYTVDIHEVNQTLKKLGEEGWELASIIDKSGTSPSPSFYMILKKEKLSA
jgi:Domain of unknown function (DUF4177)